MRTIRMRVLASLSGLVLALWPSWAWAECGPLDAGGCVDGALYRFWEGLAGMGWWIDRTLLMGAMQIDTLRWWLVEIAFTSAYQALVATISPLLAPIAIIAVMVGCLLFLLVPLIGRTHVVSIRQTLLWAVLGPLLLTISGPLIVQVELARSQVGSMLYDAVSTLTPGAIFGAPGSDMRAPRLLYPASACGVALTRRAGTGLRLDDLAAALVWADASDIHCPEYRGPSRDIPDGFFEAAPSGAGYAIDSDVSLMPPGVPRSEAVRNIQRGAIRSFVAILPSALAVLDALVQLIFALCLVALWVSLPIGLIFVGFQQHGGAITGLFRRMLVVLQVSWSTSVLMGMLVACLVAAAELRNAAAYTGFAIGGGAFVLYLLRVAVDTFVDALRMLSSTAATVTGLSAAQATSSAGSTLVGMGAGSAALAQGAMATSLVATMAYRQTGSGHYAAAAGLGRWRPLAEVGEVATAVGVIDRESELASGLYAGSRSERSLRMAARQIRSDARTTDASGMTMAERAHERQAARQLAWQQRPTIVEELTQAANAGRQAVAYVGSPQMATDIDQLGRSVPTVVTITDRWERWRQQWQAPSTATNPLVRSVQGVQHLDQQLRPGGAGMVAQLDTDGRLRYQEAPATPPTAAWQAPPHQVNLPRLLTLGYTVQQQPDRVRFWRVTQPAAPTARRQKSAAPTPTGAEEWAMLQQRGAVAASMPAPPVPPLPPPTPRRRERPRATALRPRQVRRTRSLPRPKE
jgi:hypothetical protein